MNEELDIAAAEYVLGTLSAEERADFAQRLEREPALREAVAAVAGAAFAARRYGHAGSAAAGNLAAHRCRNAQRSRGPCSAVERRRPAPPRRLLARRRPRLRCARRRARGRRRDRSPLRPGAGGRPLCRRRRCRRPSAGADRRGRHQYRADHRPQPRRRNPRRAQPGALARRGRPGAPLARRAAGGRRPPDDR